MHVYLPLLIRLLIVIAVFILKWLAVTLRASHTNVQSSTNAGRNASCQLRCALLHGGIWLNFSRFRETSDTQASTRTQKVRLAKIINGRYLSMMS